MVFWGVLAVLAAFWVGLVWLPLAVGWSQLLSGRRGADKSVVEASRSWLTLSAGVGLFWPCAGDGEAGGDGDNSPGISGMGRG